MVTETSVKRPSAEKAGNGNPISRLGNWLANTLRVDWFWVAAGGAGLGYAGYLTKEKLKETETMLDKLEVALKKKNEGV